MTEAIQVITTLPDREAASRLAGTLVEARLAGCVQVLGPIESTYRWQGAIETAQEWMCLIKSDRSHYAALETAIRGNHPYEVPEILSFDVTEGSRTYLDWLAQQLSEPEERG